MPKNEDPRITFLKKELEASTAQINSLQKENQELKEDVARLTVQVNTLKAHDTERKTMLWKELQHSQKPSYIVENPKQDSVEAVKERVLPLSRVPKPPPPSWMSSYLAKEVNGVVPPLPPPPPPARLVGGSKAVRRVPEVMEFYRSLMKRDAQRENKNGNSVGIQIDLNSKNMIGEIENRSTHLLAIKSDIETQKELIYFLTREVETANFTDIKDLEAFVKWLDQQLSCLVDERAVLKHFPQWPEKKSDAMREAAFTYRDLKTLESEITSFKNDPKQSLTQSLRRMQALQDRREHVLHTYVLFTLIPLSPKVSKSQTWVLDWGRRRDIFVFWLFTDGLLGFYVYIIIYMYVYRLEQSVNNVERVRDGISKRYREFHIPWQWMMDTGEIGQIKVSSLTLAKEYMKRIVKELQYSERTQDDDLLLQGVRFAFRVHQFAGGFDADTKQVFEELKKIGTS